MFGAFNVHLPGREEPSSPYVKATPLSLGSSGGIFREARFLSDVILKFFDNKEFFKGIPRRTWSISDSSGAGFPKEPPQVSNFKHGKERGGWEEGKGLDFSAPPSAHRDLVARPNWTFVRSCLVSLLLVTVYQPPSGALL